MSVPLSDTVLLMNRLGRLRGDLTVAPDASIVVPVNAQKDLANIYRLLGDLAAYSGARMLEVILVVNNYPAQEPPREITEYRSLGLQVIAIPKVEHDGGVAIAARIPGIRAAHSSNVLLFDADCRIPNATALIDWYIDRLNDGYDLAYTHVDYTDLAPDISVKARMWVHHASRWIRRNILGTPTSRGSNYATHRDLILDLFARGRIPYDIFVGPMIKKMQGRIAYSGRRELVVLTSGRFFEPGWKVLVDYLIWRTGYYRRILKLKPRKATTDR